MPTGSQGSVTLLLRQLQSGDQDARSPLLDVVYVRLKRMASGYMRNEWADHTLQTTGLVHEASLRLVEQENLTWQNREHFFGIAGRSMRRILIDYARTRLAQKRGGGVQALPLDEELVYSTRRAAQLVALDDVLDALEKQDKELAQLVHLKFFVGLTNEEIAEVTDMSERTVKRRWTFGKAWLQNQLDSSETHGSRQV
jgi:RNA polymerase sigma-70 factor (ECF subfamily)